MNKIVVHHIKTETIHYDGHLLDLPTVTTTTEPDEVVYVHLDPPPGEPCPMCGHKVPQTGAERQRRYRKRRR